MVLAALAAQYAVSPQMVAPYEDGVLSSQGRLADHFAEDVEQAKQKEVVKLTFVENALMNLRVKDPEERHNFSCSSSFSSLRGYSGSSYLDDSCHIT